MADFGFLSDTDESAVEELISQAQDLCVLEQVSAINCSSFTDSVLPTDLESRFRRLKSFPVAKPGPKSSEYTSNSKALHHSKSELGKSEYSSQHGVASNINFSPSKQGRYGNTALEKNSEKGTTEPSSFSDEEGVISPDSKKNPAGEEGLKGKNKQGSVSSPSNSSDSCLEDAVFSPPKQNPKESDRSGSKRKPKSRSTLGSSSNSWPDSPSPPHKSGCFWCSPKKVSSKKKSKETKELGSDLDWEKYDEFLSDMSAFSVQEQRKILKKALKEQQKLSREAAKMVKLAKQASSRMSFHGIGDKLSDDENGK